MFLDDIGFSKEITKETSIPITVFKKITYFSIQNKETILFKHRTSDSKSGAKKKKKQTIQLIRSKE